MTDTLPAANRIRLFRTAALTSAALLMTAMCHAQPTLTVADAGVIGGNRQWVVRVAPDASLFTGGEGSVSSELAFQVTSGSLLSATQNATLWPFENPGNNPFTGSITDGVVVDTGANTLFAALGSDLFTSGAPVDILTFATAGTSTTTVTWGGQTLLAGTPNQYTGSRLAQAGTNFDGYTGSLTLGGGLDCDFDGDGDCDLDDIDILYTNSPTTTEISDWLAEASSTENPYKVASGGTADDQYVLGDADLNGDVDSIDLGLHLNNFNSTSGVGWFGGDFDGDGNVDSIDLGLLLNNFNFTSAAAAVVPEPAPNGLLVLAMVCLLWRVRRRS